MGAGLEPGKVAGLIEALMAGTGTEGLGISEGVVSAAVAESRWVYADAYRRAWASIIPFVVLAIIAMWRLRGVKELMTERVEATVEKVKMEKGKGEGVV